MRLYDASLAVKRAGGESGKEVPACASAPPTSRERLLARAPAAAAARRHSVSDATENLGASDAASETLRCAEYGAAR